MNRDGPLGAEIVERLAAIGVEAREAKLYIHLVLRGPSRASDAAAATKLKRTETYRALEALMRRGFVTAHLTRPVVYEATAPDRLFAEVLAAHDQRGDEIHRLKEHVIAVAAEAQKANEAPSSRYSYKIVQGRRSILSAVESAVRNARSSVLMASTTFTATNATSQNRAFQTLVRRAGEGLPVRALVCDSPGLDRALTPLLAASGARVRLFEPTHPLRFVIVDDREITYWLVSDESPGNDAREDVAMWTNASDFVRAQRTLFDLVWGTALEMPRPASR